MPRKRMRARRALARRATTGVRYAAVALAEPACAEDDAAHDAAVPPAQEAATSAPVDDRAIVVPPAPPAANANVRKCMQGNKRANTKPELTVRKMLRELGYPGYRLQWKKCPGHPDIAYPGRRLAIFVSGCYWHRCPKCNLPLPKTNTEFWRAKFARNVARDERVRRELTEAGWRVLTIWECELKKDKIEDTRKVLYEFISLGE